MSVLIKDMEMPKCCADCGLTLDDEDGTYICLFSGIMALNIGRQDNCPLVEVPTPHGRLIDAKPLTDDLADIRLIGHELDGTPIYATYGVSTSIPVDRVYDAPTVIEAEK